MLNSGSNIPILIILFVFLAVSVELKAGTHTDSQIKHVGCYSSERVRNSWFYKIKETLSWEDGVNICNHRLTVYMGVEKDTGSADKHYIYCGNDLPSILNQTDNNSCLPCVHDAHLTCGGAGTVSLYKLREKTPLSVLVAADGGMILKIVPEASSPVTTLVNTTDKSINKVDFNIKYDEVVFIEGEQHVYRSIYNYQNQSYEPESKVASAVLLVKQLSVDWTRDHIYWSHGVDYAIYVVDRCGANSLVVEEDAFPHYHLTFDPLRRVFVYINYYELYVYSCAKRMYKEIKLGMEVAELRKLAVDPHKGMIYVVVESRPGKIYHITRVDYEETSVEIVHSETSYISSIDVFDDIIVWVGNYERVYTCKLTPKCGEVKEIFRLEKSINDVKIFHPDKQKPMAENPIPICPELTESTSTSVEPETDLDVEDNVESSCEVDCAKQKEHSSATQVEDKTESATLYTDTNGHTGSQAALDSSMMEYLGCYGLKRLQNTSYYKIREALSWEDGVNICNHRLTVYMGVEQRTGSMNQYFIYCGNDLPNVLDVTDNTSCLPCEHDSHLTCGGAGTVSLYKLREHTPLAVWLATHGGVLQVLPQVANTTTTLVKYPRQYNWLHLYNLDFNTKLDEIVFSADRRYRNYTIFRSKYNYRCHSYEVPFSDITPVDSQIEITVDWTNDNIYWSNDREKTIQSLNQLGINTLSVNRSADLWLWDLTVDPHRSLLLFLDDGKLVTYSLKTSVRREISKLGGLNLKRMWSLAVDLQKQWIYMIGHTEEEDTQYLVRVDYEDTTAEVILTRDKTQRIDSLDVFDDTLVWISGERVVFGCALSTNCSSVQELYRSKESLYDLKIYHPERQKSLSEVLEEKEQFGYQAETNTVSTTDLPPEIPNKITTNSSKDVENKENTPGKATGFDDIEYVGCYLSGRMANTSFYKIRETLSWADGMNICNHRLTVYMGVEQDTGFINQYFIYCGNDLTSVLTITENTSCLPCTQDTHLTCGGAGTVSIYKLRDSTPLTVWIATKHKGIVQLTPGSSANATFMNYTDYVYQKVDLDYNMKQDEIFFTINKNIMFRSRYNYQRHRYDPAQSFDPERIGASHLAFDWINDQIYWSNYRRGIHASNQCGLDSEVLGTQTEYTDIAMDPFRRMLFYIRFSDLYSFSLTTNTSESLTAEELNLGMMTTLALDVEKHRVYVVGTLKFEDELAIVRMNYDGTRAQVVHRTDGRARIGSMDVLQDTLVWVRDSRVVCMCSLSSGCSQVEEIYDSSTDHEELFNVKIFHPETQKSYDTPSKDFQPEPIEYFKIDVEPMGCFSSEKIQNSSYYKIRETLSWEDGVNICNHRLTVYMGVEKERGSADKHIIFCGNDLPSVLSRTDNASCLPCVHNQPLSCGGSGTTTLYRLREKTPLSLLMATDSVGVVQVIDEAPVRKNLAKRTDRSIYSVDYTISRDQLVYVTGVRYLLRSKYNYQNHSYEPALTVGQDIKDATTLAYDWIKDNTYWSHNADGRIYVLDRFGANTLAVNRSTGSQHFGLAVDPFLSLLLVVDGNLTSHSLTTDTRRVFKFPGLNSTGNMAWVRVAVDPVKKLIYVSGFDTVEDKCLLVRVDYEDTAAEVFDTGDKTSCVLSVDVFEDTLVWVALTSPNYETRQRVFSCKLSPNSCTQVRQIYRARGILDIKIFHPERQKPSL